VNKVRVVLDSSVLFSMFFEGDKFNPKGKEVLFKIVNKELEPTIPTLAVPEVCGAIRRITKDSKLAQIIEDRLNFWIDSKMFDVKELTIERMKSSTQDAIMFSLKGADAVFVSLAHELKTDFLTFDEGIKKKIKGKIKLFN